MIRAACLIAGLLLGGHAASAQTPSCYELGDITRFCGKKAGWKSIGASPELGTYNFVNQEFVFAISAQADHGQSITPALFDRAVDGILLGLDQRGGKPEGTHRTEFVEVIRHNTVEGRRALILSEFEGTATSFVVDVFFSSQHAWTTQTAHQGAIAPERLIRVHSLTMQEVELDDR